MTTRISIGQSVSYTFMDKKMYVNSFCMYEETKPITVEGMVIALWGDYVYVRTKELGVLHVLKCTLQIND